MTKKAIIIGAGPAGLTAAYELLKRTDMIPIILEKSGDIGGISKTINYKGNRMDMGPHRFFSKSDRVMKWWLNIMPLEETKDQNHTISYQNKSREITQPSEGTAESTMKDGSDKRMLLIQRLTRIYFLRKFFAYPIQLSLDTLKTLGFLRTIKIILSFLWIRLFPCKPEKSLEDFIINKFGRELYRLFFKDYTEKVWGVPCQEISAEWGAQRIKGVSLSKAIAQAVKSLGKKKGNDLSQKETETSLIEQFLYPKYGPGSLWEEVARQVEIMGGKIYLNQNVQHIQVEDGSVTSVNTINNQTGQAGAWEGQYFFSTMPVQELIAGMERANAGTVPGNVQEVAAGLQYRDFINVGILLKQLSKPIKGSTSFEKLELKDNWIYIQERDVKVGRLMIYNNWGGGMIKDPTTTWIGMEYFCNKTDKFWALSDDSIQRMAIEELEKMALARVDDVLDITVARMEKTYPAYFGTYERFSEIKDYVNGFENLFLVGRNGMHKYNNADHSMLCSMVAVDNITQGVLSKDNLWAINTEQEYHEEKTSSSAGKVQVKDVQPEPVAEPQGELTFKDFVWKNNLNRRYLIIALIVYLLQFIIFKSNYPYANYMPDSYSYLQAAAVNADVNMWPVGYSKFLRLFSSFSHSDTILTGLQYFFISISSLVFLFTLFYFTKPGKWVINILYTFFLFNLILLYVANYISADALFIGFSFLWLAHLVWIMYKPKTYMLFSQAFLLLILFTIRYNAVYYPLIAGLAFAFSRQMIAVKLAGVAMSVLLISFSILYTSNKMKEQTGYRQFSAFAGWQLANNALYMYEHIPKESRYSFPKKFAKLDQMVKEHMDTLQRVKLTHLDSTSNFFYLWNPKGPLIQYMQRQWKNDSTTSYLIKWAGEAPLYKEYATILIRNYPIEYGKYFMLNNALKFAVPPGEFLSTYNMGLDSVNSIAKDWFNYKSQKIASHDRNQRKDVPIIKWYSVLSMLVLLSLLINWIGLIVFAGFKKMSPHLSKLLVFASAFFVVNMCFSIVAAPIVLRYEVFVLIAMLVFAIIYAEIVFKSA